MMSSVYTTGSRQMVRTTISDGILVRMGVETRYPEAFRWCLYIYEIMQSMPHMVVQVMVPTDVFSRQYLWGKVVALSILDWAATKMPRMPGVHVLRDPKLVVDFIHISLRIHGPFDGMAAQLYFEHVLLPLEECFHFFSFLLTFCFFLLMDELLHCLGHFPGPLPSAP